MPAIPPAALRGNAIRIGLNARYLYDANLRGFNRYTTCLIAALQRIPGVELVLFTDARRPLHPRFSRLLGPNTRLSSPMASTTLGWEQVALPRELQRRRIDVFHAPADGGLPAWKGCRHVLTYHRALDKSLTYWIDRGDLPGTPADYGLERDGVRGLRTRVRHDLFRQLYLRSADVVIAVSEFGRWELVTLLGVPPEKVEVIPLAADAGFSSDVPADRVEVVRAKYRLPDRYLLFVGGFNRWKNVDGLLRAFAGARRAGIAEALVLAGGGVEIDALRTLAVSLGLEEGRHWLFVEPSDEDAEMTALYRGATAFVSLSWGESFSLPVVEAMTCGVPVIASRRGAVPEVLDGAGLLVDPRNAHEVHDAILRVTTDEQLRADLRARGLRRSTSFSWKLTAERTLDVYRRVLNRRGTGDQIT
jgi:glycosyltransferase involved in cell wall biosynthesis